MLIAGGSHGVTSCKFFNTSEEPSEENGEPIARVYDKYLYRGDVKDIVPEGLTGNDSLAFLQNYINVWAKDQLMIYKAEYNLTENKKNFEEQIRDYRNDLLKFTYRQDYVRQNLDTSITRQELQNFYNENGNSLLLQENIVQARYLVIDKNAPDLREALKWFRSDDQEDVSKLEDYALKYAYKFSLQDSSWVSFDRIRKIIPLKAEQPEELLNSREVLKLEDSTNIYLVQITGHRTKGERSPLEYSRDVIENILLNQRKLELIDNLEQNLLNDALSKKEFELY